MNTSTTAEKPLLDMARVFTAMEETSLKYLLNIGLVKFKEHGLVSSSGTQVYRLRGQQRDRRVSIARIISALASHLIKTMPHLKYMIDASGTKYQYDLPISIGEDNTSGQDSIQYLYRYVRLINFKCRKYGVPCYLDLDCSDYHRSLKASPISEILPENNRDFGLRNGVVVRAHIAHQYPSRMPPSKWRGQAENDPENFFIDGNANELRVLRQEAMDRWMSNPDYWGIEWAEGSYGFQGGNGIICKDPSIQRLATGERFFFFIPEVLQVLKTLSRKAAYDYRAFSFSTE